MTSPHTGIRAAIRPAGVRQALVGEWIKFRSVRATVGTLVMIPVSVVGLAGFVAATGSLEPDDTVLGGSLTGASLGQIAAAALGAMVVSGEYGSGTIGATLTANPRRTTVLTAKILLVVVVVFPVALAAAGVAYLTGGAMLAGQGYATGQPMPALLGVAANLTAVAVLGVAAGILLRHTASAITAMLGVLLLPGMLGPLLGGWRPWITGTSPLGVLQKLAQTSDATVAAVGSLGAWPSLGVLSGYTIVASAAAGWAFRNRDT